MVNTKVQTIKEEVMMPKEDMKEDQQLKGAKTLSKATIMIKIIIIEVKEILNMKKDIKSHNFIQSLQSLS
jgi:hypothetical protein